MANLNAQCLFDLCKWFPLVMVSNHWHRHFVYGLSFMCNYCTAWTCIHKILLRILCNSKWKCMHLSGLFSRHAYFCTLQKYVKCRWMHQIDKVWGMANTLGLLKDSLHCIISIHRQMPAANTAARFKLFFFLNTIARQQAHNQRMKQSSF